MVSSAAPTKARRLRWALLIALALHAALLWRYAPQLFARLDAARKSDAMVRPIVQEQVVELTPPPPPKSRGMVMAMSIGKGSPEQLQTPLPKDFFAKPAPQAKGALQLAGDLDYARASGAEIVASIIPAAARLPNISSLSDQARTPRPKPAPVQKPTTTPPLKSPAPAATTVSPPQQAQRSEPQQVPFLLPPAPEEDYDVDAAIHRAAAAAEQLARAAQSSASQSKTVLDYRAMLPQGPLVAAPPLPLGGASVAQKASDASEASGITTFALDAPIARDNHRAAPDQGKPAIAARQQYFALLTARLKATNQRLLAEAVKAGPRTTVRMKFLVDREGRVLEVTPAEPVTRLWVERASEVIRATPLPRVPDAMTQVPLELSFPIEVYQ